MYQLFLKNSRIRKQLIEVLVGNNIEFTIDHQVLIATILISWLASTLMIPFVIFSGLPFILLITDSVGVILLGVLYFLTRVLKIYKNISTYYLILLIIWFSINWFPNWGIYGNTLYFYLIVLGYIIYLTKGYKQTIFLSILVINISILFYVEYHYPELVIPFPNRESYFMSMYLCFLLVLIIIAFLVYVLKKLYQQEKKNAIDIIEQHRINSVSLKERYSEIISHLSLREREIFENIIEGKSNKEIASQLYIDEGTVKNHVTSIYRKLEVNKRIELIDKVSQASP